MNILNINMLNFKFLKGFGLTKTTLNSTNSSSLFYHRLIESFKHAFAHRAQLGDENTENIIKVITYQFIYFSTKL